MADIVKYHNDINTIKFVGFKEKEIDILFALMLKAKESEEKEIQVKFSEFNKLIDGEKNKARIKNYILETSKKLKKIDQVLELPNGKIRIFSLFDFIEIDPNDKIVTFSVNNDFKYMLNNLVGNFTLFEFKELVKLKGYYPKRIFILLKQWESTREYLVKIEDFRESLGVPKSYRMSEIRKDILKPCLEELGNSFYKLELTELKKGRNVESLKFTWKSRRGKKEDIIDIQPVKRKKATLGEKELQEHEREQLENTIQELEKKKKVKNIPSDPIVELKKITKKDYENLYKDYLERLGEQHNLYMRKSFDFINKAKYEVIEDMEREQPKVKSLLSEKDIDESLLVSKTGKKLVGMARQHKIKKLLEDMNKGGQ